jgi:hypothetical protein
VQTHLEVLDSSRSTTFSFLIFVSILGLLNFLRYYETFRNLIEIILRCAGVVTTFFVVFIIILMSLAAAEYYKEVMNPISDQIEQTKFYSFFKNEYFVAFGDFGSTDKFEENEDGTLQWSFFYIGTVLVTLIMLNLIGLLSEKLSHVLDTKERTNFSNLCLLIIDLELLMFWNRNKESPR